MLSCVRYTFGQKRDNETVVTANGKGGRRRRRAEGSDFRDKGFWHAGVSLGTTDSNGRTRFTSFCFSECCNSLSLFDVGENDFCRFLASGTNLG